MVILLAVILHSPEMIILEIVQPIRDINQIEAIKKILKSSHLRDYCLFTIGINSALRISDLLDLKIGDVVDENMKPVDKISLREKKTQKLKEFPLGKTSIKALREYLATRENCKPDDPLFPSRKGGVPMTRVQAYRIIRDAARTVGIKERIGSHTLRKTFGYHAYRQGSDITLIQKLLNHSSPGDTLAYIGITQDDLDNVYLTLNL